MAINRYIKHAQPISSQDIARDFDLSPATIRNIFAELEKGGYLTHLHTSGGRIPTNKGYRYYVDFLTSQMGILKEEKDRIEKEYNRKIQKLEDVLDKTSGVISAITHYAGIVSFLDWHDKLFYKGISLVLDQPEFRDIEKMRLLIGMVEEKQKLLDIVNRDFDGKVKVYIDKELGCPEMDGCSLVVSSYRRANRPSGRLAVLGPMRMEYGHIISSIEYISDVLSEVLDTI